MEEIIKNIKKIPMIKKYSTKILAWNNENNKSIDIFLSSNNAYYFRKTIKDILKIKNVTFCIFNKNNYCSQLYVKVGR